MKNAMSVNRVFSDLANVGSPSRGATRQERTSRHPLRLRPDRLADESGATMVEFALVAGVLILALFGFMEFSHAYWQWNSATKALQLGVRLAAVSDPVASDIKTIADLSGEAKLGDPVPYYKRSCNGATKTCSGGAYDDDALKALVYGRGNASCPTTAQAYPAMCRIFGRIRPENVIVEYEHTGLGYMGRPTGPVPTITLRLTGLNFEFAALDSLLGLPAISMSGLTATATGEDLSSK
jgi:Flp pilus assembly pilin Flp